jgi:hypothetical protein
MGLTSSKVKIGSFPPLHLPIQGLGPLFPGSSGRDGEAECKCEDEVEVKHVSLGHDNEEGTIMVMEEEEERL